LYHLSDWRISLICPWSVLQVQLKISSFCPISYLHKNEAVWILLHNFMTIFTKISFCVWICRLSYFFINKRFNGSKKLQLWKLKQVGCGYDWRRTIPQASSFLLPSYFSFLLQ
jgi:hypothetical protein